MERNKAKEKEIEFLVSESKKNPELFERKTFIDSSDFLEKIGIFFGNDLSAQKGYLKLWPQDFIVEEWSRGGNLETVDMESLFSAEKNFSEDDPTAYATLVKCKLPTFEATKDLSCALGIEPGKIQYAGIKDADAITSQLISIREKLNAKKLEGISSPYYFLKNIYSGKGAMEIGGLKGNKFTVLIRTTESFDAKKFKESLEKIKKEGFFNFFYSQRFSSPRFVGWFWGLQILKGEYKNAVLSFLCFEGEREMQYFKNTRAQIKKNLCDWHKIAEIIKPFSVILQNETKVVNYLQKNPSDFIGALKQIPEQIQLWIFAYASLLFNKKISEIIKNKTSLPEKLPLILSKDKNDWLEYYDFLKEDQLSRMPLENLMPFPNIQWRKRQIKTKELVDIHKVEIIPEGVILNFSLPKGCYATTFLAHLFQLVTGQPPKNISDRVIDIKKILGEGSSEKLSEKFKEIIFSKTEDIFGKSE